MRGEGVSLFSAVSTQEMQTARIVTGATMAAFLLIGLVPGLRERGALLRGVLLVAYLLACAIFIGYVLTKPQ